MKRTAAVAIATLAAALALLAPLAYAAEDHLIGTSKGFNTLHLLDVPCSEAAATVPARSADEKTVSEWMTTQPGNVIVYYNAEGKVTDLACYEKTAQGIALQSYAMKGNAFPIPDSRINWIRKPDAVAKPAPNVSPEVASAFDTVAKLRALGPLPAQNSRDLASLNDGKFHYAVDSETCADAARNLAQIMKPGDVREANYIVWLSRQPGHLVLVLKTGSDEDSGKRGCYVRTANAEIVTIHNRAQPLVFVNGELQSAQ